MYATLTGNAMPITEEEAHPLYATLWAVLILSMLQGTGLLRQILNSRPLVFIGQISFSLYLWHRVPINLMHRLTYHGYFEAIHPSLKAWIILTGAIVIGYLSYIIFERPVQRWRARKSAKRRGSVVSD